VFLDISININFEVSGGKYIESLLCAHQLEECNNFKDFGVQFYGSETFKKLQIKCEDIFTTMPPPVATLRQPVATRQYNNNQSYSPPASSINMTSFYDRSGACFSGESLVLMQNSTQKISTLKKGDITSTGKIECIVRTKCHDNKMQYCRTDKNLLITKYHPMKLNGIYVFPVDNFPTEIVKSDYMYSLVFEKNNNKRSETVIVNDTECVALGHGITNDIVASHTFFGTEKIIETLRKTNGWSNGLITLNAGYKLFTRDEETNIVNNINLDYEII
jgi:hypothetical protein